MTNINELMTKREKYIDTAMNIYAKHADKDGNFADSKQEADFIGLLLKCNDIAQGIKAADPKGDYSYIVDRITGPEGLYVAAEERNRPVNTPIYTTMPGQSSQSKSKGGVCLTAEQKKFSNMFPGSRNNGGFKNFNNFLAVVHSGRYDERLGGISNAMTEGVPSQGGFAVPEEFAAMLLDNSIESEIVRPRAQVWPMLTDVRKIPAWDGKNHSSNLFGGLAGTWLGEGATATRQDAKLRLMQLTAHKLAIFSQASNELLQDGTDFENQLGQAMIKALGWSMDYYFLQGNGSGQPLGLINDPALITVAAEAGQVADTVCYENLVKCFARLAPQCINNSVWLANPTTIPGLLQLTVNVGTAGSYVPVMTESDGSFKVLTRPVIFTEKLPALGSKGDIVLADLSQYAIGLRKEVSLDKSNVPGWLEDSADYRTIVRVDGQGTWDGPITPRNGDTLSWCVAIAER